jgi:nucleotide-binding universal stress UspA family protein
MKKYLCYILSKLYLLGYSYPQVFSGEYLNPLKYTLFIEYNMLPNYGSLGIVVEGASTTMNPNDPKLSERMRSLNYSSAIDDYHRARQQAHLKEILSRFTGEPSRLLSFDEVRHSLKAQNSSELGLMEIPIDSIIGSVNRYSDFTRDFLPKENIKPERWARVDMALTDQAGVPPIEVYKIGEIYFVKDGNHRVSVARQIGAKTIQAYVTEVQSAVPLTLDTRSEDLIIKAEYADFLEKTHLTALRPGADISLTRPGQYPLLEEHIAVHQYYMGLDQKRDISYEEAVAHWYDAVYQPVAQMIIEKGILRDFPNRTEGDLYLWLAEHRAALESEMGIDIKPVDAAADLAKQYSPRPGKVAARFGSKILSSILPDSLESGPPPGQWRKEIELNQPGRASMGGNLFSEILVPISGRESGWFALEQAARVAQLEQGRLYGLHVLPPFLAADSPASTEIQAEFDRRCRASSVSGSLVFASGEISQNIIERARWVDLVIVNLDYPPSTQPLASLHHGFRNLVQRCPRPILAVKNTVSPLKKVLLAFDGSPKAREALYVAAYLCGKWSLPLVVVSVMENGRVNPAVLEEARRYLESHPLQAEFIQKEGANDQVILRAVGETNCDLLLMGGYGHGPFLDVVLGSTVNRVLNEIDIPVLICR